MGPPPQTRPPSSEGSSSSQAHLQRLEEAEKRRLARLMEARAPQPPRTIEARSRSLLRGKQGRGGQGRGPRSGGDRTYLMLVATCIAATLALNLLHHSLTGGGVGRMTTAEAFAARHFRTAADEIGGDLEYAEEELGKLVRTVGRGGGSLLTGRKGSSGGGGHRIAGLSCAAHGGPSDDIAREMVYWSDIPSDEMYASPFHSLHNRGRDDDEPRYMTFEPDGGGWNNIRMAMETVVALAHATGRTLVMPPEQHIYLLAKGDRKHKKHFGFADFYHLESLSEEHLGLDIISMEEFLERQAMTGRMRNTTSGHVSFPPGNRTRWDGGDQKDIKELKEWLREVTLTPLWKPDQCMAAFPSSPGPGEIQKLHTIREELDVGIEIGNKAIDRGLPNVLGSTVDRMRESHANRGLCIYDEEMQKAPVVHFMCYHKKRVRLLTHFYTFLFFESALQDLWTKRFIRDHLRYKDDLQCVAARIVHAVREQARLHDPKGNPDGLFDSMHVRRGDFQYKATRVEADVLYQKSKNELTEDATVYIATDERNKTFFDPLKEHYNVLFLDDFMHLMNETNPNNFGMLDQLVASKGSIFFGTYFSTFTGFINRMRGYYVDKNKLKGYESGTMDSYYFVPDDKKYVMTKYQEVKGSFFAREFPTAWRDIDKGIDELMTLTA